jgi:hypothetical protein
MSDIARLRRPSIRVLRAISAGLEEIRDHFAWEGISSDDNSSSGDESLAQPREASPEDDATVEDEAEEESTKDEDYEEPYYLKTFDREQIEIAIDTFLSHLARKRLIPKPKPHKLAAFSDIFEKFFGEEHEITETARSFEEHIKGYFGLIDYENMSTAYGELLEIQRFLAKELEIVGRA